MTDPKEGIAKHLEYIQQTYGKVDPTIEHWRLVPDHPDTPDHYGLDADPRNNPNQPPDEEQGTHHPGAHRHVASVKAEE